MNLTRNNPSEDPSPLGMPMTIAASHVDGLVLALTPNSHSYNYRSAVLFGHATPVTDVDEKRTLNPILSHLLPPSAAHPATSLSEPNPPRQTMSY
jgi:nitroimidazol reductase NimA-like FMN-containing flavoprotein (pyridoxamine 5'-phosphate oxidase superfamily)